MTEDAAYPTAEIAREDGEAFGRAAGRRTAQEIIRAGPSSEQLERAGSEGVTTIMARANALAEAGLDPVIVSAWTDGAADGFNSELESAASLLRADTPPGAKH